MIAIIKQHDADFSTTPRAGWKDERFYLISAGQGIKRVYSAQCADLPAFAAGKPGCPREARERLEAAASDAKSLKEEGRANYKRAQEESAARKIDGHDPTYNRITGRCTYCGVHKDYHA